MTEGMDHRQRENGLKTNRESDESFNHKREWITDRMDRRQRENGLKASGESDEGFNHDRERMDRGQREWIES